jgi:hypothetical protein
MTRDEIRAMVAKVNGIHMEVSKSLEPEYVSEYLEHHLITMPDPEPAYWDNFPHLTNACEDDDTLWAWRVFLQGERKQKMCDGCEQLVWEYDTVWQALIYIAELEYIVSDLTLCLPCFKAIAALPDTVVDYQYNYYVYLAYDLTDVVPSEGVFTDEYWYRKAKLNYSAEDVHAIKMGTLSAQDIMARRVQQWSRY